MNISTMVRTSAAMIVVVLSGCATQRDLEATRAVAESAAQAATVAKAASDAAMEAATRAATAAAAAQATATQAQQAAQVSQACCDENKETLKRMFEKYLSK